MEILTSHSHFAMYISGFVGWFLPTILFVSLFRKVSGERLPLTFTECKEKWSCSESQDIISFSCGIESTDNEVDVRLEQLLTDLSGIPVVVLEIKNCRSVSLDISLSRSTSLKTLRVIDVGLLLWRNCDVKQRDHHPHDVYLQNISFVPLLPAGGFTGQDAEDIYFKDVHFGHIEKGAIEKSRLSSLVWNQVSVSSIDEGAVDVTLNSEGAFRIIKSSFPDMPRRAIRILDGAVDITESTFTSLANSAFLANVKGFEFTLNTVRNATGRLEILSPSILFKGNLFLGDMAVPFEWAPFIRSPTPWTEILLHMEDNQYEGKKASGKYESGICIVQEEVLRRDMICSVVFNSTLSEISDSGDRCPLERDVLMTAYCDGKCSQGSCNNAHFRSNSLRQIALIPIVLFCLVF